MDLPLFTALHVADYRVFMTGKLNGCLIMRICCLM